MTTITLPSTNECNGFYDKHVQNAIARADIRAALPKQINEIRAAMGSLTDKQALIHDAHKAWTFKEVLGPINDIERFFSTRLLRISRNDQTPLPGFDQEGYVREAGFDNYPPEDPINEFEHLRRANIIMIQNLPETYAIRFGSGFPASVRALVHMRIGHAIITLQVCIKSTHSSQFFYN